MDDPFFVVKDEVFKALNKTRGLYLRWKELSDLTPNNANEIEWTTTELRNSLRSIEWDLEDLEDTIAIVEKNPNKFRIDSKELQNRRQFIDCTRNEVKLMKEKMSILRIADRDITARQPLLENNTPTKTKSKSTGSSQTSNLNNNSSGHNNSIGSVIINTTMAARHSGTKYSKLENQIDSPSHYATSSQSPGHNFVGETISIQQQMLQSQDEQIDTLSDTVGNLKTVSKQIGVEIDEQAMMLDEFGNDLEITESKLDSTMRKVMKVLHISNDSRQWFVIGVLSFILLIVILSFIIF